jgi:hypothetical protein
MLDKQRNPWFRAADRRSNVQRGIRSGLALGLLLVWSDKTTESLEHLQGAKTLSPDCVGA